jgi:hypothetical protein
VIHFRLNGIDAPTLASLTLLQDLMKQYKCDVRIACIVVSRVASWKCLAWGIVAIAALDGPLRKSVTLLIIGERKKRPCLEALMKALGQKRKTVLIYRIGNCAIPHFQMITDEIELVAMYGKRPVRFHSHSRAYFGENIWSCKDQVDYEAAYVQGLVTTHATCPMNGQGGALS